MLEYLFVELGILPLRHLYVFKCLPLFFQSCGQRLASGISLSQGSTFQVPRAFKTFMQKSFNCIAPKLANVFLKDEGDAVLVNTSKVSLRNRIKSWLWMVDISVLLP